MGLLPSTPAGGLLSLQGGGRGPIEKENTTRTSVLKHSGRNYIVFQAVIERHKHQLHQIPGEGTKMTSSQWKENYRIFMFKKPATVTMMGLTISPRTAFLLLYFSIPLSTLKKDCVKCIWRAMDTVIQWILIPLGMFLSHFAVPGIKFCLWFLLTPWGWWQVRARLLEPLTHVGDCDWVCGTWLQRGSILFVQTHGKWTCTWKISLSHSFPALQIDQNLEKSLLGEIVFAVFLKHEECYLLTSWGRGGAHAEIA